MLNEYVAAAMRRAMYEVLADDGSHYGEIPGLDGVWANSSTLEGSDRVGFSFRGLDRCRASSRP
jgi:hypothetical protein